MSSDSDMNAIEASLNNAENLFYQGQRSAFEKRRLRPPKVFELDSISLRLFLSLTLILMLEQRI